MHKKVADSNDDDEVLDIDRYLEEAFRSAIAFFGYFSFVAFYCMGCLVEYNETEGLTAKEEKDTIASIGWIGLRTMEVGFLDTAAEEAFGDHDSQSRQSMPLQNGFFFRNYRSRN